MTLKIINLHKFRLSRGKAIGGGCSGDDSAYYWYHPLLE